MMIGPAPITSTFFKSLRSGIRRPVVAAPVGQVEVLSGQRVVFDGEAMVLRRHLDPARRPVDDRMIDPAVAELELAGASAEGEPEELVTETDAERRHLRR